MGKKKLILANYCDIQDLVLLVSKFLFDVCLFACQKMLITVEQIQQKPDKTVQM